MSFRSRLVCARARVVVLLAAPLIAAAAAGCGNYSNEDLEFMNALPEKQDLAATIPMRSALDISNRAELYTTTRSVTLVFNALLDALLTQIDEVRGDSPTTRLPGERIWGPFPAQANPGWEIELDMRLDTSSGATAQIDYDLNLRPVGSPTWTALVSGWFQASGGVRRGTGHAALATAGLRAAGFDFPCNDTACNDPGLKYVDTITVDYATAAFPTSVIVMINKLPNPNKPDDITSATYDYEAWADGSGAFSFDFWADNVPGPNGVEKYNVTSGWLGTGAGRATLTVLAGDLPVGLQQVECWDTSLVATYNDKPWQTTADVGGDPSVCPTVPSI
jgi:hypothetical protein